MAVWMPVTVVPMSSATVAIETFMTELSRVIRNCDDDSVSSTTPDAAAPAAADAPGTWLAACSCAMNPPSPSPGPDCSPSGRRGASSAAGERFVDGSFDRGHHVGHRGLPRRGREAEAAGRYDGRDAAQ